MKWGLLIANRAARQLRRLSDPEKKTITGALSEMSDNPFHGDVKFLRGLGALRRKVGDWRILCQLDEERRIIRVTAIKRRGSNTY
jgi:mRNA-degrading endonuclease RelE of RelBE toxin-antitoxin system